MHTTSRFRPKPALRFFIDIVMVTSHPVRCGMFLQFLTGTHKLQVRLQQGGSFSAHVFPVSRRRCRFLQGGHYVLNTYVTSLCGLGAALFLSCAFASPAYAVYRDTTATAENSCSLYRVVTIHFDSNGGTGTQDDEVLVLSPETQIPEPSITSSDGSFYAWNTTADGSGLSIPAGSPASTLPEDRTAFTLYAQWEDESGEIIETGWDRLFEQDTDGNGVPDVEELTAGTTHTKDPSLKNQHDYAVYAYLLVTIPEISARKAGDAAASAYPAVTYTPSATWTLIASSSAASAGQTSRYLYRYQRILEAHGSQTVNPDAPHRKLDRTADLFTSFTIPAFTEAAACSDVITVIGCTVSAGGSAADADQLAISALSTAGYPTEVIS